ncbi:MAG: GNAT family N-acetyltransferase [Desulfuromonadaceae bacterium]|nr:GNAT family N-acetyltransferase [Desulfuromonadaceae bacterium]
MSTVIRDMTRSDIDRVGEILYDAFTGVAAKYGYPPVMNCVQEGKAWAWAMSRYVSSEGIVAEVDGRVAGVVFLNKRGDVGGGGPMAIDPDFQGKTIAPQLMAAFLERAKSLSSIRVVQEAFNPTSFSFQYAYDFMPVADLLDLVLNGRARQHPDLHGNVSELTAEGLDELCSYDMPRSHFDRRTDLAYFIRWGKVLVYRDAGEIHGYLACLPGTGAIQLGPLLAGGEEVAENLFTHALALFKDRPCRTRVMARDGRLARTLMKLGFRLYCVSLLMVRGTWRPGQNIEAFGRFPEGV